LTWYFALSVLSFLIPLNQGRRVPLRFTLAPGFHISRLWRFIATFCAKLRLTSSGKSAAFNDKLTLVQKSVRAALHENSELSAKGAEYESQGQAPNNVRRVAPGQIAQWP